MRHHMYHAFRDELEKIALNAQKIKEQGQQMVAQGQMMVKDPLKASALIQQQSRRVAGNPAATPQQAANAFALKSAVAPTTARA
jgi:hypothetical protein